MLFVHHQKGLYFWPAGAFVDTLFFAFLFSNLPVRFRGWFFWLGYFRLIFFVLIHWWKVCINVSNTLHPPFHFNISGLAQFLRVFHLVPVSICSQFVLDQFGDLVLKVYLVFDLARLYGILSISVIFTFKTLRLFHIRIHRSARWTNHKYQRNLWSSWLFLSIVQVFFPRKIRLALNFFLDYYGKHSLSSPFFSKYFRSHRTLCKSVKGDITPSVAGESWTQGVCLKRQTTTKLACD